MLIVKETMHLCRKGVPKKSLYLPINFAVNPKLYYKNKVKIEKKKDALCRIVRRHKSYRKYKNKHYKEMTIIIILMCFLPHFKKMNFEVRHA